MCQIFFSQSKLVCCFSGGFYITNLGYIKFLSCRKIKYFNEDVNECCWDWGDA